MWRLAILPVDLLVSKVEIFMLVLVRMTGLFVISPVFGRRNLPVYFKTGFSLLLAIILTSTITLPDINIDESLIMFAVLVLEEFMIGLIIGFISYLFFSSVYLAGQLIDTQIGFGMVNVIDPMSNIQIPITSNLYFIICILMLLSVNGHHMIIKALFDSFTIVPPGHAAFGNEILVRDIIRIFSNIFVISIKISAPVIAAILISDVALGVIMRTVPQLNFFVVGTPLKILLGFIVISMTLVFFKTLASSLISGMNIETRNLLEHLKQVD